MPEKQRKLLMDRKQNIAVYLLPDGKHLQIEAEMQDEVHHLFINMTLKYHTLKIEEIEFNMPGVPDSLCTAARELADTLKGQNAISGLKWGNGNGKKDTCLLLKDLFRVACSVLSYAQSNVSRGELGALFPGITEEQLFKIWTFARPDMKNSCLRYAEDSPFMQRVDDADWPKGIEKILPVKSN